MLRSFFPVSCRIQLFLSVALPIFLLVALSLPGVATAQDAAHIRGTVFELNTGNGVAGALIDITRVGGSTTQLTSDANGEFGPQIVAPGTYTIRITPPAGWWFVNPADAFRVEVLDRGDRLDLAVPLYREGGGVVVSGPGNSCEDCRQWPMPCVCGGTVLPIYLRGHDVDLASVTFDLEFSEDLFVQGPVQQGTLSAGAQVVLGTPKPSGAGLLSMSVQVTGVIPVGKGQLIGFHVTPKLGASGWQIFQPVVGASGAKTVSGGTLGVSERSGMFQICDSRGRVGRSGFAIPVPGWGPVPKQRPAPKRRPIPERRPVPERRPIPERGRGN